MLFRHFGKYLLFERKTIPLKGAWRLIFKIKKIANFEVDIYNS